MLLIVRIIMEYLTNPITMAICGLLTHFLKDLMRIRAEKDKISLYEYWVMYPYQTLLSLIGTVVGIVALEEMSQLSSLTAFGAGYMSNSVADVIGKRTGDKIHV
jgi:hypothetical protein